MHKFDINDARQGRNDQDLMFGTLSIPESVEYLYTTFVRNYRGYYSQDQFTYREDPTRAIERSMINFANLVAEGGARDGAAARARQGAARRHRPGRARRRRRRSSSADAHGRITIGIDYGTNSVRAVVVDCADGRVVGTSVFDYPSGEQGVLLEPRQPHLARQNPADYIEGAARVGHAARSPRPRATPGFSRDR